MRIFDEASDVPNSAWDITTRLNEITGTMQSVEFVAGDDKDDEREPGTYVMVRLDDPKAAVTAGRVALRYILNT